MNDEKRKAIETCFGNLLDLNGSEFASTEEYRLRQQREAYLDELLTTCLNTDQKALVVEVLEELEELEGFSARETKFLYEQGFRDCVYLLKQLEVLS